MPATQGLASEKLSAIAEPVLLPAISSGGIVPATIQPGEWVSIYGTNLVPRMSLGGEISIIMPIVNAPFRLYYAYNPLRLYETPYCNDVINGGKQGSCSAELITRTMFPPGGAGDFTYNEADGLGPLYIRTSCSSCHQAANKGPGSVQKMSVVGGDDG